MYSLISNFLIGTIKALLSEICLWWASTVIVNIPTHIWWNFITSEALDYFLTFLNQTSPHYILSDIIYLFLNFLVFIFLLSFLYCPFYIRFASLFHVLFYIVTFFQKLSCLFPYASCICALSSSLWLNYWWTAFILRFVIINSFFLVKSLIPVRLFLLAFLLLFNFLFIFVLLFLRTKEAAGYVHLFAFLKIVYSHELIIIEGDIILVFNFLVLQSFYTYDVLVFTLV